MSTIKILVKISYCIASIAFVSFVAKYFMSIGYNKYISTLFTFIIFVILVYSVSRLINKYLQNHYDGDMQL